MRYAARMHPLAVLRVLVVVSLANSVPVAATNILGGRFAWPLDFGIELPDGQRLFGRSKTIRGVLLAVLVAWIGAPLVGIAAGLGAGIGALAMAGDLLSSFVKRRLNRPSSSQALGLDQVPESLFPLLACIGPLDLTARDIAAGVAVFFVGELLLSRLLFRLHLRDRPY